MDLMDNRLHAYKRGLINLRLFKNVIGSLGLATGNATMVNSLTLSSSRASLDCDALLVVARVDDVSVLAAHGERLLREDVLLVGLAERTLFEVERLPQLDIHRRVAATRAELRKMLS